MALVALDGDDVPKILVSLENASQQLNPAAVIQLFATIQNAAVSGLSRQAQLSSFSQVGSKRRSNIYVPA
jgi:hypothetical protein